MGRRYVGISNQATTSTAYKSLFELLSATTIRPRLYDLLLGAYGTPNDYALSFLLQRATATGTGTAYTPIAIDPGDPATLASCEVNCSAEPTYTANSNLLQVDINLRATFRWVAAPGGEIVLPAAAQGVGLQVKSPSYTGQCDATFYYEE